MKLVGSHWKDWEVWLEDSLGRRLNEYQVEYLPEGTSGMRVAKVHVECEDGQEFAIAAEPPSMPLLDWKMKAKVDGRNVAGVLSMNYEAGPALISTFFEAVSGSTCERNLAFSKINRIEDGPRLDSATATQLGTIEVLLEAGASHEMEEWAMPELTSAAQGTIDEKMKKVELSSYVGGGTIVGQAEQMPLSYLVPDRTIPCYKIQITYATRPVLMLKDIIPTPRVVEPPARIAGKKKRKSDTATAKAGPSRRIEPVNKKKRKTHAVDQAIDRKPVIDAEDERKPIVL